MPLAKSKNKVGLGNMLMQDRFSKNRGGDRKKASAIAMTDHASGEQYLVNEKKEASWMKMRSVTEQAALDEFLSTAELAGTDFTAEKRSNVKIIHTDQKNPYLLSSAEEKAILGKHKTHKNRLTVPRRPQWDETTTPAQLDAREREAFLNWRRGLAELQESNDLLMTPFERNLEVWRQLWRVIERSDIVVQIVDARNPLLFRSEDLEQYVKDVDPKKKNLLLINKADMMTTRQRRIWADYLRERGIEYRFFSAILAKESTEAELEAEKQRQKEAENDDEDTESEEESEDEDKTAAESEEKLEEATKVDDSGNVEAEKETQEAKTLEDSTECDVQILTVQELENIFFELAPSDLGERKLQVGLVGYPNVGKSSTINALIGATKVSVSSTPGKTKHFQTIHLSERVVLCDCPGLVFPNFATTKADLVCNGVLPIDQLRERNGPAGLVAHRIPQYFIEALYGIQIKTRPLEEGGTGIPSASELLSAYAKARGFQTQGLGQPDEARAARYVLKDYVSGKLLFCHPPPIDIDAREFNAELYDLQHLPERRRRVIEASMGSMSLADEEEEEYEDHEAVDGESVDFDGASSVALSTGSRQGAGALRAHQRQQQQSRSAKSEELDAGFFGTRGRNNGHLKMPFNYRYTQQGQEAVDNSGSSVMSGRKARTLYALEHGLDAKEACASDKHHFAPKTKGNKGKRRQAARAAAE